MNAAAKKFFAALGHTKLVWGVVALYLLGIVSSPVNRRGINIFLSPGNQSDVLRQVSNNGLIAVGMTLVILAGGIDLSVGSMMALGSVVSAMLLTEAGWTNASVLAIPVVGLTLWGLCAALVPFVVVNLRRRSARGSGEVGAPVRWAGVLLGAVLAAAVVRWLVGQLPGKFGVAGVLTAVPAVGLVAGAVNGVIITKGKLQPFIVTLAMMVALLGTARLLGGANSAVHPVYSGSNATEDFDVLRALVGGILPVPGIFFLTAVALFALVLRFTTFGRYVYATGGNEQSARLAGVRVDRLKIATYAVSGMLASLAGVLYTAQYRQGKADAGAGAELDAIAAVVIGGTNLSGGRGSMFGTLVGVLIFGFLGNILQLKNIDSNTQLVLKGLIIVGAVLLQESQANSLTRIFAGVRGWFPRRIRSTTATPATRPVNPETLAAPAPPVPLPGSNPAR